MGMFVLKVLLLFAGVRVSIAVERSRCLKTGNFNATFEERSLQGHVFATHNVDSPLDCTIECISDVRCASFNLQIAGVPRVCELNKKSATSDELEDRPGYMHYGTSPQNGVSSSCASSPCENGGRCIDGCLSAFECACAEGFNGEICDVAAANFSLIFPARDTSYFAGYQGLPNLSSFTFCLWLNFSQVERATFFSYTTAAENQVMALRYMGDGVTQFVLNGVVSEMYSAPLNDNTWHHVCITWNNTHSHVNFYVDGFRRSHDDLNVAGHVISGGGTLIIGQWQLVHGGDFEMDESFSGQMSHINIWSSVLNESEILQSSLSCTSESGDVLGWAAFFQKHIRLNTWPVPQSVFQVPQRYFVEHTERQTSNYAKTTILNALTELTISTWVRVEDYPGLIFSYIKDLNDATKFHFYIGDYPAIGLTVQSAYKSAYFNTFKNDGWHHLAATWNNIQGSTRVYLDGTLFVDVINHRAGRTIPAGGDLYIGQKIEKDGTLIKGKAFLGSMSGLNIWDRAFGGYVIAGMSKGDGFERGNVFSWSDMTSFIHGSLDVKEGSPIQSKVSSSNFRLNFPTASSSNWAKFAGVIPTITQLTACVWISPTSPSGAVLHYANSDSSDAFAMYIYPSKLSVAVTTWTSTSTIQWTLDDGAWHFVCMKWKGVKGTWVVYYNGPKVYSAEGLNTDGKIKGGGVFALAQEMDDIGGGFDSSQAYAGEMSHANVWDDFIGYERIEIMSRGCNSLEGNVVFWSGFRSHVYGDVEVKEPAPCTYPDYAVSTKRDQWCINEFSAENSKPECENTLKALFDVTNLKSSRKWRCYHLTALKKKSGLYMYDEQKESECFYTRNGQLSEIGD